MSRVGRSILIALALVALLSTAAKGEIAGAHARSVCGPISGDVTWVTNRVYALQCTVVVPASATLSIEPGAEIAAAQGTGLTVQGTLLAEGARNNPIIFQSAASWQGIAFDPQASPQSVVNFAYIAHATTALNDFPGSQLNDDTFVHDGIAVATPDLSSGLTHDLTINDVSILYAQTGVLYRSGGQLAVSAKIEHAQVGVDVVHSSRLAIGVVVEHCDVGVRVLQAGRGAPARMGGTFYGNRIGLQYDTGSNGSLVMGGSIIVGNQVGLDLIVHDDNVVLDKNTISDNRQYNIELTGDPQARVTVPYGWWGTTDRAAIEAKIKDCHSDPALPCLENPGVLTGSPTGTAFSIDTVRVRHRVGGQWRPTTDVRAGETIRLVVSYRYVGTPTYAQMRAAIFARGNVVARTSGKRLDEARATGRFTVAFRLQHSLRGHLIVEVVLTGARGAGQALDTYILPLWIRGNAPGHGTL